jgi:hypothetical protein
MGVDLMKSVFNLEPKYRVTMLTTEDWTRESGTPLAVKGIAWFTDGTRRVEGHGTGVYEQSADRRRSICLGKHAIFFHPEV